MIKRDGKDTKNSLPAEHEDRRELVTLESSPNTYISYPAYGEVYVDEFDIHGDPARVSFRQYRCDGTLGVKVMLGLARECEWRNGFRHGAKIAEMPAWAK